MKNSKGPEKTPLRKLTGLTKGLVRQTPERPALAVAG